VVLGPPEGHAEAVGEELILFQADPLAARAHREAAVDVELAIRGAPRPDEAILPVAVAHPGQLGMRAQRAQDEGFHGVEVVGIEPAFGHEGWAQPHRGLRGAQEAGGVGGDQARGLRHCCVGERTRLSALLAPCEKPDGGAGERGESDHEGDQRDREARSPPEQKQNTGAESGRRHGDDALHYRCQPRIPAFP
jgi:hypothetical protein